MNKIFRQATNQYTKAFSAFGFGAALLAIGTGAAFAADAQPRDFLPAPAGTSLGLLYGIFDSYNTFVTTSGYEVPGSKLETYVGIARGVYFFDIGDMRADFNVVQPFGKLDNMSIGGQHLATSDVSLGDTSLVFTIWPLNDPSRNLYFAVATYLTMPTGNYDPYRAGLGSNRWSVAVQPAFYFDIAPKWSVDLVGDVTVYSDNGDGPGGVTIKKDPSITGIFWLNYQAADTTILSLGLKASSGGEETWGNVGQGNINEFTARAAWLQMLDPTTQLVVQLSSDIDAYNTFKRDIGALVRLAKFF